MSKKLFILSLMLQQSPLHNYSESSQSLILYDLINACSGPLLTISLDQVKALENACVDQVKA